MVHLAWGAPLDAGDKSVIGWTTHPIVFTSYIQLSTYLEKMASPEQFKIIEDLHGRNEFTGFIGHPAGIMAGENPEFRGLDLNGLNDPDIIEYVNYDLRF